MEWEVPAAELILYDENGVSAEIPLSDMQLLVCMKILGIKFNGHVMNCFSDETLAKLLKIKGNPLNLQEIE